MQLQSSSFVAAAGWKEREAAAAECAKCTPIVTSTGTLGQAGGSSGLKVGGGALSCMRCE